MRGTKHVKHTILLMLLSSAVKKSVAQKIGSSCKMNELREKRELEKIAEKKKLKKKLDDVPILKIWIHLWGTFDDDTKCQKLETGLLLHLKEFREQKGHWHERNWLRMNGILAGETGGPISGFFVVSTCFMSSCRESADPCPKLAIVGSTWWRTYGQLCIDEQLPLSLQLFAIFAGTGSQWEERNGEE